MLFAIAIPVPATSDAIVSLVLQPAAASAGLAWLAPLVWASSAFIAVLVLTRRPATTPQPHAPATLGTTAAVAGAVTPHPALVADWPDPTPILDQAAAARDCAATIVHRERAARTAPLPSTTLDAE